MSTPSHGVYPRVTKYTARALMILLIVSHLIVLVCVLGDELRGAVGEELVLLDHDVPLRADGAKVAELDPAEVGLEDEDVVELDVEVAQALAAFDEMVSEMSNASRGSCVNHFKQPFRAKNALQSI